jgi:hypothetical protein
MQGGGYSERAARLGVGLEVANAIRDYLDKAGGDSRLALALAVADALGNAQGFRRSGDRINAC